MKFTEAETNPMGNNIQSVTIGDITISQFGYGKLWLEDSADDDSACKPQRQMKS